MEQRHSHPCRMPPRYAMNVVEQELGHCSASIPCFGTTPEACDNLIRIAEISCLLEGEVHRLGGNPVVASDKWMELTADKENSFTRILESV